MEKFELYYENESGKQKETSTSFYELQKRARELNSTWWIYSISDGKRRLEMQRIV